jgi:Flp pilus assembly pilin Flp
MVEYAIILVVIALVVIGVLQVVGKHTSSAYCSVTQGLQKGAGCPGQTQYTNQVINPSFEKDTAGWVGGARSTLWASSGSASLLCTSASGTGLTFNAYTDIPVTPGATYSATARINKLDSISRGVRLSFEFTSSHTYSYSSNFNVTGQSTLSVSATAPVGDANLRVSIQEVNDGVSAAANFYVDSVLLEQAASATTYFDGDSPNGTWTGTPNNSTSTGWV